jgi:RNA-dependent RNA polymerase
MEKKHKRDDQKYKSTKILGQLYDKVESVNFIPQYEKPFDKRILRAYPLEDSMLKTVRQTKSQYDTAMRRILAQYEINTEFEVWSTFVLSRPRVGSDYKVQEEMARISEALKDRFRQVCIEKAGGKDFAKLGPFVAGMYKVTKEELDIAIAECRTTKIVAGVEIPKRRMEPRFMPLISFPWLFEKELGRIATGVESTGELEEMLPTLSLKAAIRKRASGVESEIKDFIEFEDGHTVHRGELLDLFRRDDDDIEHISEDSDFGEARSVADYRGREDYMQGENGETVLKTEFTLQHAPSHLHGGTGVEEVVPRIELDGLIDLSEPHHITPNVAVERHFTNALTSDIHDIGTRRIADSDPKNRFSGSSFEDLALLDGDSYANISLKEGESIEVEEVELEVPKSALEKLQELMAS